MSKKQILIVEDNPINMELASDLLEAAGYITVQAENAEDGIRLAQQSVPDLVLMDIALPGMDGLTATTLLLQNPRTAKVPIVALTAHAMKGDEDKALEVGCVGYITKPINTRSFARLVTEYCNRTHTAPLTAGTSPSPAAVPAGAPVPATPVPLSPITTPAGDTAVPVWGTPSGAGQSAPAAPLQADAGSVARPTADRKAGDTGGATPSQPDLTLLDSESEIIEPPLAPSTPATPATSKKRAEKKTEDAAPYLLIPRRGRGGGRQKESIALVGETSAARILVVDDDELNREMITAQLRLLGYDPVVVVDGFEAIETVDESFDLVLLDYMMPGMDGCQVCQNIREEKRLADIPVIMVTALSNREDQLRAVQVGANDWITKPVDRNELAVRVKSHLKFKAAQDALKRHQRDLESTVRARTAELRKALEQVTKEQERTQEAYLDTMHRLALAAEFRDGFMAAAHIRCVGNYCASIARGMGLPDNVAEILLHASPIHDIGMLGVPEHIIHKGEERTAEEEVIYRDHTVLGARLLSGARSELLRAGEVIALSHHEKWDGSGYPHGRSGESIPLYGRICAVADTFDTITAYRGDEWQATNEEAKEVLLAGRGSEFDPTVIDAFFKQWEEIETFQKRYRRTEAPPEDLFPRKLVA